MGKEPPVALHRRQVTYSSRPNHAARSAHARGDKQFRTYDTSAITGQYRIQHRGHIVFGVVLAVVVALVLFFAIRSCAGGLGDPELLDGSAQAIIVVDEGESTSAVAQELVEAKIISRTGDFTQAAEDAGATSSLKPGSYKIAGGTSAQDIVNIMVAGPEVTTFTVSEGQKAAAVAEAVAQAYGGTITAEDFMACVNNASAYTADFPFVDGVYDNSLEGFLFPKTYQIQEGATADMVVRQMLSQYQTEVATLDYSYPASQGLSAYGVLKLASVVEKESDQSTRGLVASVFYNRLAQNMRLQSDATVAYVVGHSPSAEEIDATESPYNTYKQDGLPAGPICSPGLEALQAVCSPEQSNYLYFYFVRNDAGGLDYHFSETYEQHQAAIAGNGA